MDRRKKLYITIFVLLGIYFVVMFIFVIYPAMKDGKRETYVIVNNDAKWKYEDRKWQDISIGEKKLYNWQKFDIYQNQKELGNYFLLDSNGWHIYDDERNPVKKDGVSLFAIRSNQDYEFAFYDTVDVDQENIGYVEEVLNEHNITTRDFTVCEMFSYDLDQDGEEEKVFTVSNMFITEYTTVPRNIFNFIFVVDSGKIIPVLEEVDTYDKMYHHCSASVAYVVDLDGNGTFELITSCSYYSNQGTCIELYEKVHGKYDKVKSCE